MVLFFNHITIIPSLRTMNATTSKPLSFSQTRIQDVSRPPLYASTTVPLVAAIVCRHTRAISYTNPQRLPLEASISFGSQDGTRTRKTRSAWEFRTASEQGSPDKLGNSGRDQDKEAPDQLGNSGRHQDKEDPISLGTQDGTRTRKPRSAWELRTAPGQGSPDKLGNSGRHQDKEALISLGTQDGTRTREPRSAWELRTAPGQGSPDKLGNSGRHQDKETPTSLGTQDGTRTRKPR